MSYEADETYDVYDEKCRKAAKQHVCCACKETIRIGDYYWHIGRVFDREADTLKRCVRCQNIHVHLRTLAGINPLWPDEHLNCGEEYLQHWGRNPPEEIAALAFATPDEMQNTQEILNREGARWRKTRKS